MKKIVKIFFVIVVVIILNFVICKYLVATNLDLQDVYLAKNNLYYKQEITIDDLITIKYPKNYLPANVVYDPQSIVNHLVSKQLYISAGSFIYQDDIVSKDDPDNKLNKLSQDEVIYSLDLSQISTQVHNLRVNQYVDLYFNYYQYPNAPIVDCLFYHVLITSIKDHQGREIRYDDYQHQATSLSIILAEKDVIYLSKIDKIADLEIYIPYDCYQKKPTKLNLKCKLLDLIN